MKYLPRRQVLRIASRIPASIVQSAGVLGIRRMYVKLTHIGDAKNGVPV